MQISFAVNVAAVMGIAVLIFRVGPVVSLVLLVVHIHCSDVCLMH